MAFSGPMLGVRAVLIEAVRTKSGLVGFAMLALLLGMVIAVPIIAPFNVVCAWGSIDLWLDNPRFAAPDWLDTFSAQKQHRTVVMTNCFTPDTVPLSDITGPERSPGASW